MTVCSSIRALDLVYNMLSEVCVCVCARLGIKVHIPEHPRCLYPFAHVYIAHLLWHMSTGAWGRSVLMRCRVSTTLFLDVSAEALNCGARGSQA